MGMRVRIEVFVLIYYLLACLFIYLSKRFRETRHIRNKIQIRRRYDGETVKIYYCTFIYDCLYFCMLVVTSFENQNWLGIF